MINSKKNILSALTYFWNMCIGWLRGREQRRLFRKLPQRTATGTPGAECGTVVHLTPCVGSIRFCVTILAAAWLAGCTSGHSGRHMHVRSYQLMLPAVAAGSCMSVFPTEAPVAACSVQQ